MVAYAAFCGLSPMLAVSVFGLAGLSGLGGRIGLGIAADRIGAKPTLVAGLVVQALAVGTYLFVGALGEFYTLSVIFGLAYGGVMPLYAVLVRDYFGEGFAVHQVSRLHGEWQVQREEIRLRKQFVERQ